MESFEKTFPANVIALTTNHIHTVVVQILNTICGSICRYDSMQKHNKAKKKSLSLKVQVLLYHLEYLASQRNDKQLEDNNVQMAQTYPWTITCVKMHHVILGEQR